jgi:PhzF family phenazine biosynthesis protein
MQIYQVDAFTKELFQGNPAAVVPLPEWLPDDLMQRIAMENNLAETAFFIPEGHDFVIRWFTPSIEVALCGHATLASGHVLFEHLGYKGDRIRFRSLNSGFLEVSRSSAVAGDSAAAVLLTLNFPAGAPQPVDPAPLAAIFEALGISPHPLFKGPFDYMVVLDDPQAVTALQPDFKLLATVPARGVVVTAPGAAVPNPGSGANPSSAPKPPDFVSRCFFPQSGVDEDPVTGSAHTMLVPYWAARLGKQTLSAIQLSARRGYLDCRLDGDRVHISGYAKTFMKGEILL